MSNARRTVGVIVATACCPWAGAVLADAPATRPTTAAAAQQQVDNPLYAGWSKWKVGSTATYDVEAAGADGRRRHLSITAELKSLTADGVEIQSVFDGAHRATRTIPARVDATLVQAGEPKDVTVLGKTLSCRTVTVGTAADGEGGDATATDRLSDEVVGGVVTLQVANPDRSKVTVTITASHPK